MIAPPEPSPHGGAWVRLHGRWLQPAATAAGLAAGALLHGAGLPRAGDWVWIATTAWVLIQVAGAMARSLWRRQPGVDLIAVLAMASSLALGEDLAGAVIALMLSGGQALEAFAGSRARRELSALLERAPRTAHRYEDGLLVARPIEEIAVGDVLLVPPGAVVPVDGRVASVAAVVDESALTGEARPVERARGDEVRSGCLNAGGPFDLRATARAGDSTYAGIVRLVAQAQASKAPFARMADRYALGFTGVTVGIAGSAWALSGDPVRALAVLVVATPCPLILAAPVAIVSGISRAARRGIVVKGGKALEGLAQARRLLMDKTGTLTAGVPAVTAIETEAGTDPASILGLAASLDQVSSHVFASAIVRAARDRGLPLSLPADVAEVAGRGIEGAVQGFQVRVGRASWVVPAGLPPHLRRVRRRLNQEGLSHAVVAVTAPPEGGGDGSPTRVGIIVLEDPLRADTPRTIRALRDGGIEQVVVLTGDQSDVAAIVGDAVGADRVIAECSPEEKVEAVRAQRGPGTTVMVGDGLNDAAALAAADVGVALGARGASAHSEAADAVIVVDRLDRLAESIGIAKRSYSIARQSIVAGMGLSAAAMIAAALGTITPVAGALVQEAIDVAVILNALRALTPGRRRTPMDSIGPEVAQRFRIEHARLLPKLDELRRVGDTLNEMAPDEARRRLEAVRRFLVETLEPHEEEDDRILYPVVAAVLGGDDPTAAMSRGHQEIRRLIRRYAAAVDDLPPEGPDAEDARALRGLLYGLYAVLRLHFAQEEESYLSLGSLELTPPSRPERGPSGKGPIGPDTGMVGATKIPGNTDRSGGVEHGRN
ncbi:MAG TPA: heavy metal translocating P-type ATPase [Actinomycetota bacterium]|nr:heavy metal translocating P-type ATPase [Actinomycetota bacterium]